MNRFILFLFLFSGSTMLAQRPSFVYIQAEPAQPFVVSIGEQVFKSSQSGYLILSKLTDTAYAISVSFPSTQWPAQFFSLQVNHTDKGYLLKDFGDKGWGLMDWQKLTTQFSRPPTASPSKKNEPTSQDDDFASLLAKASGDPSLISPKSTIKKESSVKDTVIVKEVVKIPTIVSPPVVETKDTFTIAAKPQEATQEEKTVAETKQPLVTSVVTRRAESSTTEGFGLVFVDTYSNGQSDTIRLIIPNKIEKVELPVHCKEIATEELLAELRKQLTIAGTELKMIAVAKQFLSVRCYTTAQIRGLSSYFLTDQGKYDFLLEAWASLSDKENILTLTAVFSSKEIADRFKELLQ